MTKKTLKKHYERKYQDEGNAGGASTIELIRTVPIPTSRFEACVKFFPLYFKRGNIIELGAGNGNIAKTLLNSELLIESYTLCDLSLPRIKGLLGNLKDNRVSILQMDAENIPESEYGKYGAVIMV